MEPETGSGQLDRGLRWDRSLGWCKSLGGAEVWEDAMGGCKSMKAGVWGGREQLNMGLGLGRSLGGNMYVVGDRYIPKAYVITSPPYLA